MWLLCLENNNSDYNHFYDTWKCKAKTKPLQKVNLLWKLQSWSGRQINSLTIKKSIFQPQRLYLKRFYGFLMCKMILHHITDGVICRENEKCATSDIFRFLLWKWHLYTSTCLCTNLFSFSITPATIQVKVKGCTDPTFCALLSHSVSYSWEICEPPPYHVF